MSIILLAEIILWLMAGIAFTFLTQAFFFWLLSLLKKMPDRPENAHLHNYTCVITAYKNIILCNTLVESIQKNKYPNLEIILIADNCDIADFHEHHPNVRVIVPEESLGSKVKSMQYAMQFVDPRSEGVVILDPDNLLHPDFFFTINAYFHRGFEVVQGIRIAKNKNSVFAQTDSLGEFYYNFTDRLVTFKMGCNATISGSGMIVQKQILHDFLFSPFILSKLEQGNILGEDKMLQNFVVLGNGRVAFEPEAIIYDEKLVTGKQVERQRTRWFNTFFENLGSAVKLILTGLKQFNWSKFSLGLMSIKPPLIILHGGAFFIMMIALPIDYRISIFLACGFLIFTLFFMFACWKSPHSRGVASAIKGIPKFVFFQFRALLNTRKHKKDFLETENTQNVTIDDVIKHSN